MTQVATLPSVLAGWLQHPLACVTQHTHAHIRGPSPPSTSTCSVSIRLQSIHPSILSPLFRLLLVHSQRTQRNLNDSFTVGQAFCAIKTGHNST